ncbi:PAS domain-containing protein [Paracoccus aerodenitrificans]|uniref:PAS domain-containing protein n=1 Tax=Paracoccus aerodenitrificans TaxID=3017781 RepID=UPI0022F01473|nr:PAS domain-containing protein [Paracoccus aerodenitrificans]WBU65168.1 PAS domain-containing protein [Paracoccus aerodenitrificans]
MSDDIDEKNPAEDRDDAAHSVEKLRLVLASGLDPDRILSDLRGYWDGLRKGRAVPDRADVEPQGIRGALDYAFILERIAPGAARFRLAGRHLVDLMGMEVRGMPVCSLLNPDSRGRFSDVLETVFKGPQIAELSLKSASGYGRPALSAKMLFLPLRSDLGDVTRALGCIICGGQIGRAPRRFDLVGDAIMPVIDGARPLPPNASGFDEDPTPWRPPLLQRPVTRPLRDDETPEERRARFRIITRDTSD